MDTGVIPDHLDFIPAKTYATPQRNKKKQIEEGRVPQHIIDRTDNCPGFLVEVVSNDEAKDKARKEKAEEEGKKFKADPRLRCYICNAKMK